ALLEFDGHEVFEAEDGERGLATILEHRPDVALLDIGLPGLDGYAVARAVRESLGGAVRLFGITGYGSDADRERGIEAGLDDYLVKPVDPALLAELLARTT